MSGQPIEQMVFETHNMGVKNATGTHTYDPLIIHISHTFTGEFVRVASTFREQAFQGKRPICPLHVQGMPLGIGRLRSGEIEEIRRARRGIKTTKKINNY